jgi:DNA-binding IclR family transcriptional regulator
MTDRQFQPVKSADRTLEILETLAAAPNRLSLGGLARTLSIPKSSLHGILRTMVQRGWVETDQTGLLFGLGVRALLVGTSYIESDSTVARAQPLLEWLNAEVGETTHLGRLDGSDVVYLAKRESSHPLRMYSAIGRRLPAHSTALGKALLAQRGDAEVVDLLPSPLPRLTPSTITEVDVLLAELATTRAAGYAVDREESTTGIRCYATALPATGRSKDAISVSVPTARLDDALETRIIDLLGQVSNRLPIRA